MSEGQGLPFSKLIKLSDRVFGQAVRDALLKRFDEQIRTHYVVAEWVQLQSGEWVVELERTLDSYD